ncbi:hypothetical protein [Ichthyobacterium seriolicida]|uniref:Secreted protein n=1 Tax=Ichthyobacterium seriolicida TaxID=242600 RepID=A0A1J1DW97_9FLAO|nr:hypothetical protein [Ichthyobacterium seriolicida]BAV94137.1 hypothetical protein JBKA6_0124 [Ichthyobacterium seriolicida]
MKKIFLLLSLLFVFSTSINAQDAFSGNIEPKTKSIVKADVGILLLSAAGSYFNKDDELILALPLSYEKMINNHLSFEIGISTVIRIIYVIYDKFIPISTTFILGPRVSLRYYFFSITSPVIGVYSDPIGFYLSPFLGNNFIIDSERVGIIDFNGGLTMGYQWITSDTDIYYDVELGILFGGEFTGNGIRPYIGAAVSLFSIGYLF